MYVNQYRFYPGHAVFDGGRISRMPAARPYLNNDHGVFRTVQDDRFEWQKTEGTTGGSAGRGGVIHERYGYKSGEILLDVATVVFPTATTTGATSPAAEAASPPTTSAPRRRPVPHQQDPQGGPRTRSARPRT